MLDEASFHMALIFGNVCIQLFSSAMGKIVRQIWLFYVWYEEKENSGFESIKLRPNLTLCRTLIMWRCWVND